MLSLNLNRDYVTAHLLAGDLFLSKPVLSSSSSSSSSSSLFSF